MNNVVLLADKDSPSWNFAEKIKEHIKTDCKIDIPLLGVQVSYFRNKEIEMHVPTNLRKKSIYFVHDSSKNPQEWWVQLLLLKDLLIRASAGDITFVLPSMMYSRQDRKHKPHVPISAKSVADTISGGVERIITMDLHAPQIQGFYNIPLDNLYSFPDVCNYSRSNTPDLEDFVIVSPDAGGVDRAKAFAKRFNSRFPIAFVEKRRSGPGEVDEMYLIGEVSNKNIFVVDDIIDSGNTLVEVAKVLKSKDAKKLLCYGTHAIFSDNADERLLNSYERVMVSDTIPYSGKMKGIEVISVAKTFGEAIYRTHQGLSISELFDQN